MPDFRSPDSWYLQSLTGKRTWYSAVASAYNRSRPRYPQELLDRVLDLVRLPERATILELGCGPGIATVALARLGFSILALEPSQEACQLARQNCAAYPNVEIENTSFEEWERQERQFDAVVAASSFHWISPEVASVKAARSLHSNGFLILLWNTPPQPEYDVYQSLLHEIYGEYAPSLAKYEGQDEHQQNLDKVAREAIASGLFKDLVAENLTPKVTYSIDDYLALLSTLSPYIALQTETRDTLFNALKNQLTQNLGSNIELVYLSAFHIARKA